MPRDGAINPLLQTGVPQFGILEFDVHSNSPPAFKVVGKPVL